ncbi:MAG: hypothetical protein IPO92_01155 [Saprospiraceae bacterium]|nr:hypothetical protein [Saprospiraceae bacterium]
MSVSFNEFMYVSQESWMAKSNKDLKEKIRAEDLKYFVEPGLEFNPFLTGESTSNRLPVIGPKTIPGVYIDILDSHEANLMAIEMLSGGTASLAIAVDEKSDFDILFEGIYLDMIRLVLVVKSGFEEVRQHLDTFFKEHNTDFPKEIIIKSEKYIKGFKNAVGNLKSDLSFQKRLNLAASILNNHVGQGLENLTIEISLKQDFLAQIAELRAIRILWANILNSNNASFYPLTIITNIDTCNQNIKDKHPLIAVNFMLMSAYFGMSDIAFGCPVSEEKEMARLSLNIQHIFKEESLLDKVKDPTAGSYIIESLTDMMVENTLIIK